jgi:hypothetical protein
MRKNMSKSPEQFKPYSMEEAEKEASKMQEKIKSGEAEDYSEAESLVEGEKKLMQDLQSRDFDSALEIKREFPSLFSSPKAQMKLAEALIQTLRSEINGLGHERVIKVYEKYKDLLEDQNYLYESAKNILSSGYTTFGMMGSRDISETIKTLKILNMPEDINKEIAINAIGNLIAREKISDAIKLKSEFAISNKELYSDLEFLGDLKKSILKLLDANNNTGVCNILETKKLAGEFEVPDDVLKSSAKQAMFSNMRWGRTDKAMQIQKEFSLPPEEISKGISSDGIASHIISLLENTSLYNVMEKTEEEYEKLIELSEKGYLSKSEVDKLWESVILDKKLVEVAKREIKNNDKNKYAREVARLLDIKD